MEKYKIIILGPPNTGKSTLLQQINNTYKNNDIYFPTVGVDLSVKTIFHKGKPIKLQFWDTAGQERFDSIVSLYYKKAEMVFIVIDISDTNKLKVPIDAWIDRVYKLSGDIPIILIGNKIDKVYSLEYDQVKKANIDVNQYDKITKYFEISAHNQSDVDGIIKFIIDNEIIPNLETKINTKNNENISLDPKPSEKKKSFFKYFCYWF